MTSKTLLQSMQHFSDPIAKFALAVKRDLKPQVAELVASLAKTWQMSFYCDHEEDTYFDTLKDVPRHQCYDSTKPETRVWQKQFRDRLIVIFANTELKKKFHVDLVGMAAYLRWKESQISDFVRTVLTQVVKTEPAPHGWRTMMAIVDAARRYLKSDDALAKATERWFLLSQFRDGRIFELRHTALPVSQERPYKRGGLSDWEIVDELNPIVDRMLEVGMTMEEIRKEFLKWIEEKGKAGQCRWSFMLAVAGANCFKDDHKSLERVRELLRKHYLPSIKKVENDIFFAAEMYQAFGRRNIEAWKQGDEKFFRPRVVDALSHGSAGAVYQWLLTYGYATDFYSNEVRQAARGADTGKFDQAVAWKMMHVMAPKAVQLAIKGERFGVAAALTQYFPEAAKPEKIRELISVALDLEQPISLQWQNAIKEMVKE